MSNNEELKEKLRKVDEESTKCQIYQKAPLRPIGGLWMANQFQETVAMDLKFYKSKTILHLIEMLTQISSPTIKFKIFNRNYLRYGYQYMVSLKNS